MKVADSPSTLVTADDAQMPVLTSRIDPQGAARMMQLLVNVYSDRRLAVVREAVSNGVDATRRAGSAEPVRVTTPTVLEPNLVISDRGTGMNLLDLEGAFLAFASSTKMDSADEIGGMGVGAKSPWTLAESFLIDTVKDGRRTIVRAAKDLKHQVLMVEEPTDLPGGTTLSIPVEVEDYQDDWERVIAEVAAAHGEGGVLVDGAAVPSLIADDAWIGPVAPRRVRDSERVTILSGGTLFSATPEVRSRIMGSTRLHHAVVELPLGSFDFTPRRESVIATDRTMVAVEAALADYRVAYDKLNDAIAKLAATDILAAAEMRRYILGGAGRSDEHLLIPYVLQLPVGGGVWRKMSDARSGRPRWMSCDSDGIADAISPLDVSREMGQTLVVTGVPAGRKIRGFAKFLAEENPDIHRVVPVPEGAEHVSGIVVSDAGEATEQTWKIGPDTDGVLVYTYSQLTRELANRRVASGGVAGTGYLCIVSRGNGQAAERVELTGQQIADLGLPVWFVRDNRPRYTQVTDTPSVGVYLGRRKEAPLLKAVPGAVEKRQWLTEIHRRELAAMTHDQLLSAAVATSSVGGLLTLSAAIAEEIDQQHPLYETISALAGLDGRFQVSPAQKAAFGWMVGGWETNYEHNAAKDAMREAEALKSSFVAAYPLVRGYGRCDSEERVRAYVHYVTHTPPMNEH